jgi:predicted nucleic acid-binding protein
VLAKPLRDVPPGADVYIDANVFVYAMLQKSQECLDFIRRCGTELHGFSDVKVFHDTMHKLMLAEAGLSASTLRKRPETVKALTKWQKQCSIVRDLPVEWIDLSLSDLDGVPSRTVATGFLCGDALISVLMNGFGITTIASRDEDFLKAGLSVFAPTDV